MVLNERSIDADTDTKSEIEVDARPGVAAREWLGELGLRPVINASATLTRLGGSLMPPSVVEAMVSMRLTVASGCQTSISTAVSADGRPPGPRTLTWSAGNGALETRSVTGSGARVATASTCVA